MILSRVPQDILIVIPARMQATRLPGKPLADIAGKLFLSEGTVRNYLSSAIAKIGVRNRMEAVRVAEGRGWL